MVYFADPIFSDDLLKRATNGDTSSSTRVSRCLYIWMGYRREWLKRNSEATKSAESGNVKAMQWLGEDMPLMLVLLERVMDQLMQMNTHKKLLSGFRKELQH